MVNGKYIPSRLKLHNQIIRHFLKQDISSTKPDLYIFGGVGGSGKGSNLKKYVREKAVMVDNDKIKSILAEYNPSPIKKYLLLHAAKLHEESGDIEKKLIEKLLISNKDVVLDRTLANFDKSLALVKRFHNKGYQVTTLGTNLKPHTAIARATKRFLNPKNDGRYVPLNIIVAKGNKINKNVLQMAKRQFNKRSLVLNTTTRKGKVMYEKGKLNTMKKTRRKPSKGVKLSKYKIKKK